MEPTFSFTKTQLIAAFKLWNADLVSELDEQGRLPPEKPTAPDLSAEVLIRYLTVEA